MPDLFPTFLPWTIHDPEVLQQFAYSMSVNPTRLEKDIWVNLTLKTLSAHWDVPEGAALFAGGTSLTKGWRLANRFSEDIDFRFQGNRDWLIFMPENLKRDVHASLHEALQTQVASQLPEGQVNIPMSAYTRWGSVQRVWLNYRSFYQAEPGQIKLEIMFMPVRVPWEMRDIHPHPIPLQANFEALQLGRMACVVPWATMTGKLHAVAQMRLDTNLQAMRHVVDLATWMQQDMHHVSTFAYMVQQGRREHILSNLKEKLGDNLDALEQHPQSPLLL